MAADEGSSRQLSRKKFDLSLFISIFVSYACYTYNRKSVSHVLPVLIRDGLPKQVAGTITSSQNMAYALSRFFSGILSDRVEPRFLLVLGLVLTGLTTVAFPWFDSQTIYVLLWFFNGFAQGFGWPACAKVLKEPSSGMKVKPWYSSLYDFSYTLKGLEWVKVKTKRWFSSELLGKLWSILSCSANLSGAIGTLVSTQIILAYSWRTSLVFAGASSLLMAVILFFSLGNDIGSHSGTSVSNQEKPKISQKTGNESWQESLNVPLLVFVSFCYFMVVCAKTCCADWTPVYLTEELAHSPTTASVFVGSLEIGGLVGSITAGFLSDLMIKSHIQMSVNSRLMLSFFYIVILCLDLHVLCFFVSAESSPVFLAALAFTVGVCLFGPITLFGIVTTESVPSHLSGTAHAFVSLSANAGGVVAGFPFAFLAKNYSWWAVFFTVQFLCCFTVVFMIYNCRFWLLTTKKQKSH